MDFQTKEFEEFDDIPWEDPESALHHETKMKLEGKYDKDEDDEDDGFDRLSDLKEEFEEMRKDYEFIEDPEDIKRRQASYKRVPMPSTTEEDEKNEVLLLIIGHGAYPVNRDDTIDKIRFPRKVESIKSAVFGKQTPFDYDTYRQYPMDSDNLTVYSSNRHSEKDIMQQLRSIYHQIVRNPASVRSSATIASRKIVKHEQSKPEFIEKYGRPEHKGVYVKRNRSSIPFLNKVFKVDDKSLDEYGSGILLIFPLHSNIQIYNITYIQDLERLFRDLGISADELIYGPKNYKTQKYDSYDYGFIFDIISKFPAEYETFKIVDDTCSSLAEFDRFQGISKEREQIVISKYFDQMVSENPTECRGGSKLKTNHKSKKKKHKQTKRSKNKKSRVKPRISKSRKTMKN
jgi:hypothetical protein